MREPRLIYLCVPCFNPTAEGWASLEAYLGNVASRMDARLEVTVVDDGSPQWQEPPATFSGRYRVLRLPSNQGKGAALKAALDVMPADAHVFAFTDFDVPYSVENLLGVCSAVTSGSADLCIGDRTGGTEYVSNVRFSRLVSHHFFRLVVRSIIAGGVPDTQCGVKAYRAEALRRIRPILKIDGFLFDVEWIYVCLRHSLTLRRWPVALQDHHESRRFRTFWNPAILSDFSALCSNIARRRYDSSRLLQWTQSERERTLASLAVVSKKDS